MTKHDRRLAGAGAVALSCQGVSKVFPVADEGTSWRVLLGLAPVRNGITALNGVSLAVPKGRIHGVLGSNGAGKSTLLRALGGVYTPTTGRVQVRGSLTGLFELGGLGNQHLTGREYAYRSLMLQGASRRNMPALVEDIKEFSELGGAFEEPVLTYSAGMTARLYFAAATAMQHDVYLIDELLTVGDEHFQAKCWQRVRERLSNGASGLLVTHDWTAVLKTCESSYILDQGRIVAFGPSDKIVAQYLELKPPEPTVARIVGPEQPEYFADSEAGTQISVTVEILEEVPVAFAFSIELLRVGFGWAILVLERNMLVGSTPGVYDVTIDIPELQLAPGDYSLNFFLASFETENRPPVAGYDVRSWTYGNGYRLVVRGPDTRSTAVSPLSWSIHG